MVPLYVRAGPRVRPAAEPGREGRVPEPLLLRSNKNVIMRLPRMAIFRLKGYTANCALKMHFSVRR